MYVSCGAGRGIRCSEDLTWLGAQVLRGVGSAGQNFSFKRWRELTFFVRFMLAFKRLDSRERVTFSASRRHHVLRYPRPSADIGCDSTAFFIPVRSPYKN